MRAVCCLAFLVGCQNVGDGVAQFYDTQLSLDHPVDWWHQLQGGPVAADRPPPPGITDPYPNFSKVPPRPAPVDFTAKRALVARLTTERDRTVRQNAQDPIVFASPNAAPAQAGAKPATKPGAPPAAAPAPPPADADISKFTIDAATAPPAPAAPPPAAAAAPPPPAELVQGAAPVVEGPLPAIPQAAPPLPQLPGLPTSNPVPVVARPVPTARISFAAGSAALPAGAETALKALAARRAGGPIGVVAGGEARSASAEAQRQALPLALRRTGAIAAALLAAGVPPGDIKAEALAQGRDATARLLN